MLLPLAPQHNHPTSQGVVYSRFTLTDTHAHMDTNTHELAHTRARIRTSIRIHAGAHDHARAHVFRSRPRARHAPTSLSVVSWWSCFHSCGGSPTFLVSIVVRGLVVLPSHVGLQGPVVEWEKVLFAHPSWGPWGLLFPRGGDVYSFSPMLKENPVSTLFQSTTHPRLLDSTFSEGRSALH